MARRTQSWQKVNDYDNGYYASRLRGHIPRGMGDSNALKLLNKESMVFRCLEPFIQKMSSNVLQRQNPVNENGYRERFVWIRMDFARLCEQALVPTMAVTRHCDRSHPTEDRMITPREAARLQGFPDWFQFHPTKWHNSGRYWK